MDNLDQKVSYELEHKNVRGDVYSTENRIGRFIGFTPDYEKVVIEELSGQIVHIDYHKVRFIR